MEDEIVEPYYAGWLSLLPPVIAITLALLTKEVISSLLIGILTGTFIYSVGMNSDVLFMGTIESAFDTMANKVDFNILVFCTLLGALVYTISMGGQERTGNGLRAGSRAERPPCCPPAVWVRSFSSMTISIALPSVQL